MFCFPGDHQNNNKSFSNGTCSSVFFPSPTLNPQLSLAYDYRYHTCSVCLITRGKVREGVQSCMWTKYRPEQGQLSEGFYFDPPLKIKRLFSSVGACFLQPFTASVPAHSRAGSPRRHALGTFRHVPPQPFPASPRLQFSVALGVGRLGAKSQPARGPVFQRLHAFLRARAKTEPPFAHWRIISSSGVHVVPSDGDSGNILLRRWWRNESHFVILGPGGGGSKYRGIWTSKIFFMVWNTWPAFIQQTFWHLRHNGGTPEHRRRLIGTLLSVLWTTGCSWVLSSVLKVVTYHEKCVKLNFPELVLLTPLQHSWEFVILFGCNSHTEIVQKQLESEFFYISMNPPSGGGQSATCNSWSSDVIKALMAGWVSSRHPDERAAPSVQQQYPCWTLGWLFSIFLLLTTAIMLLSKHLKFCLLQNSLILQFALMYSCEILCLRAVKLIVFRY